MLLQVLKSKIHRATVTEANVNYEGSITLDSELMEKASLLINEMVHIWDATEGHRLYTYCMPPAPKGSGTVCINGAAARLIKKGHIIIITSFVNLTPEEYKTHKPNKVIVDEKNRVKQVKHE
ncbi:MAG: aspartate 1-decarboxylase [Deltaproteobacteria bacterium]|nr:aspartate 1-decarboxylase [Deltaproteobacteria bacterium]